MSGSTRVFVKRTKAKASKNDRWPVREVGKKGEKVLVELPTTRPVGPSAVGGNFFDGEQKHADDFARGTGYDDWADAVLNLKAAGPPLVLTCPDDDDILVMQSMDGSKETSDTNGRDTAIDSVNTAVLQQ